jgi:hypothetical protein
MERFSHLQSDFFGDASLLAAEVIEGGMDAPSAFAYRYSRPLALCGRGGCDLRFPAIFAIKWELADDFSGVGAGNSMHQAFFLLIGLKLSSLSKRARTA